MHSALPTANIYCVLTMCNTALGETAASKIRFILMKLIILWRKGLIQTLFIFIKAFCVLFIGSGVRAMNKNFPCSLHNTYGGVLL
jgi:hypothetical protein